MDLYFSPMACSLASRIVCYEADARNVRFVEVDPKTKRVLESGRDYREIYSIGLVPALVLDDGSLLTENAAVLQYLAGRYRALDLAPSDGSTERARLQQWLCFIGTELHKAMFVALFEAGSSENARARTLEKSQVRLDFLNQHLEKREFLLDSFSVADAYLYTILNWAVPTRVDLSPWPAIAGFHCRVAARPHVTRATAEERALYEAEMARHRSLV